MTNSTTYELREYAKTSMKIEGEITRHWDLGNYARALELMLTHRIIYPASLEGQR